MEEEKTEKEKAKSEPKGAKPPLMLLRTTDQLTEANEWLFNQQKDGKIDPKTADSLNTTLKNSVYLNVKLKMDYLKIFVQAQIKKIEIPKGLLPE